MTVFDKYSVSIEKIRKSPLKRQVLYTQPFIKIDNKYIASNPFLILCLFSNSIYWILRNKYLKKGSQTFINAFGNYFEIYVEEMLNNTLDECEFLKIPTVQNAKRADWKLKLGKYDFLIEQKSSLPLLSIKQNETDIKAIKKYINACWGEAVEQLNITENAYHLSNAIKIILVYDEYFKAEALDQLFELRKDLFNTGYYWLVNIEDFEKLIMLYKKKRDIFNKIIEEKINDKTIFSKAGKELFYFYKKYDVTNNEYLKEYGIWNEFEKIKKYLFFN